MRILSVEVPRLCPPLSMPALHFGLPVLQGAELYGRLEHCCRAWAGPPPTAPYTLAAKTSAMGTCCAAQTSLHHQSKVVGIVDVLGHGFFSFRRKVQGTRRSRPPPLLPTLSVINLKAARPSSWANFVPCREIYVKRATLEVVRLDDELRHLLPQLKGRVGALKADVEGGEPAVSFGSVVLGNAAWTTQFTCQTGAANPGAAACAVHAAGHGGCVRLGVTGGRCMCPLAALVGGHVRPPVGWQLPFCDRRCCAVDHLRDSAMGTDPLRGNGAMVWEANAATQTVN